MKQTVLVFLIFILIPYTGFSATYRVNNHIDTGIPLGGIGTGGVELRADGKFHEWQIYNNQPWGSALPLPEVSAEDAFFSVRYKEGDNTPVLKMLQIKGRTGDWQMEKNMWYNAYRTPYLTYIDEIEYTGEFPYAVLNYKDSELPLNITLKAYSPFIPQDAKNSGLPGAYFCFTVQNTGSKPCEVSLLASVKNYAGYLATKRKLAHTIIKDNSFIAVSMSTEGVPSDNESYGSVVLAAVSPNTTYHAGYIQTTEQVPFGMYNYATFFDYFKKNGILQNAEVMDIPLGNAQLNLRNLTADERREWEKKILLSYPGLNWQYHDNLRKDPSFATDDEKRIAFFQKFVDSQRAENLTDYSGALSNSLTLQPGDKKEVVYILSWFFPNFVDGLSTWYGHMYANWFNDALEVTRYLSLNRESLSTKTQEFHDALYKSKFDYWFADALNAQLTTLVKSSWWTKDNRFAIWEGLSCCGMHCIDVDYYGSWQPFLFFPELEKATMRVTAGSQREDGRLPMVMQNYDVPKERKWPEMFSYRPVRVQYGVMGIVPTPRMYRYVDVELQFSSQVYRDYLFTGDKVFLKEMWPSVMKSMESLKSEDIDGDLIPDVTGLNQSYDTWPLRGTTSYVGSIWIMTTKVVETMARILGEDSIASAYNKIHRQSLETFEKKLWNGEYYSVYYADNGKDTDPGCMADQMNGQWYATMLDLGYIFPEDRVKSALRSVYKYNRIPREGLVNGVWLDGRWVYPSQQFSNPWTGTEYSVSSAMISEGLVNEGLQVMKDVYDRYQKAYQTWNHLECGEHYSRPQVVWCNLLAILGIHYNAPEKTLKVEPKIKDSDFESAYVLPRGWGILSQVRTGNSQKNKFEAKSGSMEIKKIIVPVIDTTAGIIISAVLDGSPIFVTGEVKEKKCTVNLQNEINLKEGSNLEIGLTW